MASSDRVTSSPVNGDVNSVMRTPNGNIQERPRMAKRDSKGNDIASTKRQPISHTVSSPGSAHEDDDNDETRALLSRYKYYTKLAPHSESALQMPEHIVPENYWIKILIPVKGKQSSIITIFSLWNTMMGTSILSMPWAIQQENAYKSPKEDVYSIDLKPLQAGFITGICLLIFMAGLMLYTSYRILKSVEGFGDENDPYEFSDVCRHYLGRWAEIVAVICSLLTLLGGAVVYWILMSNFLYNVVSFIYFKIEMTNSTTPIINASDASDALCPRATVNVSQTYNSYRHFPLLQSGFSELMETSHSTFAKFWDEQDTVPFFLIVIMFPLLNFKSPTFFTKFNSLGTISVTYLVCFVAVKASHWNFNVDMNPEHKDSSAFIENFRLTFPALTGIAALAYFVQNCCIAICRNQKNPENNARDLTIAYILVCTTYVYMGTIFYAAFPLEKSCIQDNLLNNIATSDIMAFVARIGLFFQMLTVLPLLCYILRIQLMLSIFKSVWPSWRHVVLLNLIVVGLCVIFAVFEPHIGHIIGFVGAFCGFSYAIALPCLVYMLSLYHGDRGNGLTWPSVIFHSGLIVFGFANFIAQFVIIGHTT